MLVTPSCTTHRNPMDCSPADSSVCVILQARILKWVHMLSRSVMFNSCDPMDCSPAGSSVHGYSPGKYTGVGCHSLLQGIFPNQGSNPGLPHCKQILYHLSHQRNSIESYAAILNDAKKTVSIIEVQQVMGFPCDSAGSIPGLGRSPGKGKGDPPQYSGLENSMDCTVLGVAKSQTQLSNFNSMILLL